MLFRLPIPPSVNGLYANVVGRGRVKTKAYTNWLKQADAWYYLQRLNQQEPITGPAELHIRLPRIRGDASNRVKAVEDYLVSRKLTGDDRNNRKVTAEIDPGQDMRECWVTVTPAQMPDGQGVGACASSDGRSGNFRALADLDGPSRA